MDRIGCFIAALFLAHFGVLRIWQDGPDVMVVQNEAYRGCADGFINWFKSARNAANGPSAIERANMTDADGYLNDFFIASTNAIRVVRVTSTWTGGRPRKPNTSKPHEYQRHKEHVTPKHPANPVEEGSARQGEPRETNTDPTPPDPPWIPASRPQS